MGDIIRVKGGTQSKFDSGNYLSTREIGFAYDTKNLLIGDSNGGFTSLDFKSNGVNPDLFGAIGDGLTDDTKALQDTIDYCCEYGYDMVLDYKAYVTNSDLIISQSLTIKSKGYNKPIIIGKGGNNIFKITSDMGVLINNIQFNTLSLSAKTLYLENDEHTITNCKFINVVGSTGEQIYINGSNIKIDKCKFTNNSRDIYSIKCEKNINILQGNINIHNNAFNGEGRAIIIRSIEENNRIVNIGISNNEFNNSVHECIRIENIEHCIISNNSFFGWAEKQINLLTTGLGINTLEINNNIINNNYGVINEGVLIENLIINNNTFNNSLFGITIENLKNVIVSYNIFNNCDTSIDMDDIIDSYYIINDNVFTGTVYFKLGNRNRYSINNNKGFNTIAIQEHQFTIGTGFWNMVFQCDFKNPYPSQPLSASFDPKKLSYSLVIDDPNTNVAIQECYFISANPALNTVNLRMVFASSTPNELSGTIYIKAEV
jgi:hypothetical protein